MIANDYLIFYECRNTTTLDNENNKSSPGVNKILNTIAAIGTQDEYKKKNNL